MMTDNGGNSSSFASSWSAFMDDLHTTAEEYRDRGYEVVEIHTGDVVALPDNAAIDILAPGDEFETLQTLMNDFEIDEYSVFTADVGSSRFVLVIAEDHDQQAAVCCPLFIHGPKSQAIKQRALAAGFIQIQIRPLSDDDHVVFTIDNPSLLFD